MALFRALRFAGDLFGVPGFPVRLVPATLFEASAVVWFGGSVFTYIERFARNHRLGETESVGQ
jgi:hypothetical protein